MQFFQYIFGLIFFIIRPLVSQIRFYHFLQLIYCQRELSNMKVYQELTINKQVKKFQRKHSEQLPNIQKILPVDVQNLHNSTLSKISQKIKKSNQSSIFKSQESQENTQRFYSPDLIQRLNRLKKIEEFDKKIEQKLFKIRSQKTLKIKVYKSQSDKKSQKTEKKHQKISFHKQSKNVQSQPTPTKQNQILQDYYKPNQRIKTQIVQSQKLLPRIIKIKKKQSFNQQSIFTQNWSGKKCQNYKFQILHAYQTRRKSSKDGDITVNQDSYLIKRNLGQSNNIHLFAVFDGHGRYGHQISNYLKVNLSKQIISKQSIEPDRHKLIRNSFNRMLIRLYETSQKQIQTSGSTAICCMIEKSTLYVSNIGDSRAIMGFQAYDGMCWQCKELSTDHVPSHQKQASRILQNGGIIRKATMGGQVQSGLRVWAKNRQGKSYGIRMTRSFGDSCLSSVGVTHMPQIKQYELDERNKIIVIGSDGLYQKMSNFEIIDFLAPFYQRKKSPQEAGQKLLKHLKSRMQIEDGYEDDITFIILFLNKY